MMIGGATEAGRSTTLSVVPSDIHLDVRARIHPNFGWFQLSGRDEIPFDGLEFEYAINEARGNFVALPVDEAGWKSVAFPDSDVPMLAFRGRDCIFTLRPK